MNFPVQLLLNIQLKDDTNFNNYCIGSNKAAIESLKSHVTGKFQSVESLIYLYGSKGVGLSHLLQAVCRQCDDLGERSMYLPMSQLKDHPPTLLDGMERLQQICIDDLHEVSGITLWEEALFNLFNRLREANVRLLIAARQPPKLLGIELDDLVSRLSWGIVYKINPLTEQEQVAAIQLRTQLIGHDLSDEVARFMVNRNDLGVGHLFKIIKKLDRASFKEKRKLTIPFIKDVMNW